MEYNLNPLSAIIFEKWAAFNLVNIYVLNECRLRYKFELAMVEKLEQKVGDRIFMIHTVPILGVPL